MMPCLFSLDMPSARDMHAGCLGLCIARCVKGERGALPFIAESASAFLHMQVCIKQSWPLSAMERQDSGRVREGGLSPQSQGARCESTPKWTVRHSSYWQVCWLTKAGWEQSTPFSQARLGKATPSAACKAAEELRMESKAERISMLYGNFCG